MRALNKEGRERHSLIDNEELVALVEVDVDPHITKSLLLNLE